MFESYQSMYTIWHEKYQISQPGTIENLAESNLDTELHLSQRMRPRRKWV